MTTCGRDKRVWNWCVVAFGFLLMTCSGAAWGQWEQLHKLTADGTAAGDCFGWSVSINADLAIVGAYGVDDDNGTQSGSAYVFGMPSPHPSFEYVWQHRWVHIEGSASDEWYADNDLPSTREWCSYSESDSALPYDNFDPWGASLYDYCEIFCAWVESFGYHSSTLGDSMIVANVEAWAYSGGDPGPPCSWGSSGEGGCQVEFRVWDPTVIHLYGVAFAHYSGSGGLHLREDGVAILSIIASHGSIHFDELVRISPNHIYLLHSWAETSEHNAYCNLTLEIIVEPCPADFDGDGDVDTADLLFLLGAWGTPDGDVDGDGDTDTADLLALLAAWGDCP